MNRRNPARDVESRTHGPAVTAAGDGLEGSYAGTLFSVPSGGKCKVVIPSLDPVNWRTANCSPAFTGSAGDVVLVTFDWDKQPWVTSAQGVVRPSLAQLGIARGTGSVTFSSSTTSGVTTVTHGLGSAPTAVHCMASAFANIYFTVGSIGATTFGTNADSVTAITGSFAFSWIAIL